MYNFDMEQDEKKSEIKKETIYHENIKDNEYLPVFFDFVSAKKMFIPSHWHKHMEVLLIINGKMEVNLDLEHFVLSKNDVIFINSNSIHSTKMVGNAEYVLLQIPESSFLGLNVDFSKYELKSFFPNSTDYKIKEKLLAMKNCFLKKDKGYNLEFLSHLYEFLHRLFCEYMILKSSFTLLKEEGKKQKENFYRIAKIISYVEEKYRNQITMNEVANLVSVSPEYLCRFFKKYTGQSFFEYLMTYRISKFYDDFLNTDKKIAVLLEENGINNHKVFLREFKKIYGKTPSQIRS
jgi:AraC-like DNA-binding protein/quercetin dioxygenase-like cupin family protein